MRASSANTCATCRLRTNEQPQCPARTNLAQLRHFGLSLAVFNFVAALIFVLVWRLNQRAARRLQRQIDELNALEGQR
jgi:hypothetical protein